MLVFLLAFALGSGFFPAVADASHSQDITATTSHSSVSKPPSDIHESGTAHQCTTDIFCPQTLACLPSAPSVELFEWSPVWFSLLVRKLTERSFGPEPSPPIS